MLTTRLLCLKRSMIKRSISYVFWKWHPVIIHAITLVWICQLDKIPLFSKVIEGKTTWHRCQVVYMGCSGHQREGENPLPNPATPTQGSWGSRTGIHCCSRGTAKFWLNLVPDKMLIVFYGNWKLIQWPSSSHEILGAESSRVVINPCLELHHRRYYGYGVGSGTNGSVSSHTLRLSK